MYKYDHYAKKIERKIRFHNVINNGRIRLPKTKNNDIKLSNASHIFRRCALFVGERPLAVVSFTPG